MRAAFAILGLCLAAPLHAAEPSPAAAGAALAPALSPDGARVAFVSDVSGIPQLWLAPLAAGWPARLTRGDEPVQAVRWSPDGKWLAYTALAAGGSARRIRLARFGKAAGWLAPAAGDWSWLGAWSPEGAWLGFSTARRTMGRFTVGLYEPPGRSLRHRISQSAPARLTSIGPKRRRVLIQRFDPAQGWQVFLHRLRNGKEVLLTPHRRRSCSWDAVFGPSGNTVYLITDAKTGRPALARVRLANDGPPGSVEILAQRGDADLERLVAAPGGRWGALLWNASGRSELGLVDLATGRILPGPDLPAEVVHGLSITRDGQRIAVSASGPAMPPDIWLIDRAAEKIHRVTSVPHGGMDLADLVRPRLERFRSHDGVELDGWFYRAPRENPPLVLFLHEEPQGQARPEFQPLIQALVRSGISVFAPNVRGSGGRGRDFAAMDDGPQRLNAIRDVEACAEWLIASGRVARGRLGIFGRGYGGYLALSVLADRPNRFAAGVLVSSFADLEALLRHTAPWVAPLFRAEYGDPARQQDMLRALSPIHRIQRVRAPLLLLHGRNDPVVPVEESEEIAASLNAAGVESKLIVFENEGRRILRRRNRLRAAEAAVQWLTRHLNR